MTMGGVSADHALRYYALKDDCDVCPFKMRCCPKTPSRKVTRDVHEDARDMARRLMRTKIFLRSRDERKRVEMRFMHLKTHHGFERIRLRGLPSARGELHLVGIVQNLKTLALRLRSFASFVPRLRYVRLACNSGKALSALTASG